MDAFVASTLIQHRQQRERFVNLQPTRIPTAIPKTPASALSAIVSLAIGALAAHLSWTCNAGLGLSTLVRAFYATFAFLFGTIYLLFYVVFRAGTCPAPEYVPHF